MRRTDLEGALLFAFIPLVLWLFLKHPLGPGWSVGLGVLLMFSHRFVAAPWMRRHAEERCLWCGGSRDVAEMLSVVAGGRMLALAACDARHRDLCGRFLTFVVRFHPLIALGIFAPLGFLLAASLALAAGHPFVSHETGAAQFRIIVALTVAGASLAYHAVRRPADRLRSPFPLHNLFLLGIRNTLWIFRLVGTWWLAAEIIALFR